MEFSQEEIAELSGFFAKRFPDAYSRIRIANEAGVLHVETETLSPEEGWERLLRNTQESGGLARLAVSADRLVPDDELLHEVSAIIAGYRSSNAPRMMQPNQRNGTYLWAAGGGGVVGCVMLALGVWLLLRGPSDVEPVQQTAPEVVVAVDGNATTIPTKHADLNGEATVANSSLAEEATPASEAMEATASESVPPPKAVVAIADGPKVRRANDNGRCTLSEGGLVGYWYAGSSVAAVAGESITMEHSVNVRLDYPDKHNGFDKRTPIRCTLHTGDLVKLREAPLLVPGDRYWVPLYSGDLIQNGEEAAASASAMR